MTQKEHDEHRDAELSARETRILTALGASLEAYAQSLKWLNSKQRQIYNIQFRAPIREQGDWLMLVKAVGQEAPEIAFHSDVSVLNCIAGWPSRLSAGRIKWQTDEYPPQNYEVIEAWVRKELGYKAGFGWD